MPERKSPSKKLGWVPDLPDIRDFRYRAPQKVLKALPTKMDLTRNCPPVYNQGDLGSCTANAIGGAFQFEQMRQGIPNFVPSRLFIYYNERAIEHTINSDAGAQIRDGIKTVNKNGVCPEAMWPYDEGKFIKKPGAKCYAEALKHQALSYMRISNTLPQLKGCLADGFPFVFGFTVYDAFESNKVAKSGHLLLPDTSKEKVVGGHAVMAVGYDDSKQWFIIRNSWGTDWGLKGYYTMPYAYLTNSDLCDDFWTIRIVEA